VKIRFCFFLEFHLKTRYGEVVRRKGSAIDTFSHLAVSILTSMFRSLLFFLLLLSIFEGPDAQPDAQCAVTNSNLNNYVFQYFNSQGNISSQPQCSHNIEVWDVSSVTDFTELFSNASDSHLYPFHMNSLSINLSRWDTSKVTSMSEIFKDNENVGLSIVGIETWNTANVETLYSAFDGAKNFNSDISGWNVSKVSDFDQTFNRALRFNADIGSWNTARALKMRHMFAFAHAFNADLSCWSTQRVIYSTDMFHDAEMFDARGLWSWNVSKVTDFLSMFFLADRIDTCTRQYIYMQWPENFKIDYPDWGHIMLSCLENPLQLPRSECGHRACVLTSMSISNEVSWWLSNDKMHDECGNNVGSWNVSRVTNLDYALALPTFNGDISRWDVMKVTSMEGTFQEAASFNRDLSAWNVVKVTNMERMFYSATSYTAIGIENWDVSAVRNFNMVFDIFNNSMSNCTREAVYTSWSAKNPTHFPIGATYVVPFTDNCDATTVTAITTTITTTTETPSALTTTTSSLLTTEIPIPSTTTEGVANSSSSSLELYTIIAISGGLLLVLSILAIACFCWNRRGRGGDTDKDKEKIDSEIELHNLRKQLKHQSEILATKDQEISMLSSAWIIDWSEVKVHEELAQGAYGNVFRGKLRGRFKVAIKMMFDSSDTSLNEDAEIRILQRARHPRLVMFFGCGKKDGSTFIVLEYMDRGSLDKLIEETHKSVATLKSTFSWPIRLQLLHDVATGMNFLHNLHKGCIHRDLKSANILLAVENENEDSSCIRAKVADFGLSRFIDKGAKDAQYKRFKEMLLTIGSTETSSKSDGSDIQDEFSIDINDDNEEDGSDSLRNLSVNSSVTMTCGAGTPTYMAPETWASMERDTGAKRISNKIDVYAYALIMWEVLERQRPWSDLHFTYKIKKLVVKGRRPPYSNRPHPDTHGRTEPRDFKNLLESCWENDPHDRPTFASILETMGSWLSSSAEDSANPIQKTPYKDTGQSKADSANR